MCQPFRCKCVSGKSIVRDLKARTDSADQLTTCQWWFSKLSSCHDTGAGWSLYDIHWGSYMNFIYYWALIYIWTKGEVGTPWNRFKPSSIIYFNYNRSKAVLLLWIIYVISVLFLLCFLARLFINALWSPAGKGLTSWLSLVMFICEVVTFPFVSWVRCGAWLYRFLIFALFLTFIR